MGLASELSRDGGPTPSLSSQIGAWAMAQSGARCDGQGAGAGEHEREHAEAAARFAAAEKANDVTTFARAEELREFEQSLFRERPARYVAGIMVALRNGVVDAENQFAGQLAGKTRILRRIEALLARGDNKGAITILCDELIWLPGKPVVGRRALKKRKRTF